MSDLPDSTAFISSITELTNLPEDTDLWVWWSQGAEGDPEVHHSTLVRRLDDRRYVGVMPFLFTHAVIWGYISDPDCYEDRWCYKNASLAIAAASAWDGQGEPEGWHRHPRTGRRRPDGDPEQEYVNP